MNRRLRYIGLTCLLILCLIFPFKAVYAADSVADRKDGRTFLVAASDFQASSSDEGRKSILTKILNQMSLDGLNNADHYMFVGDYNIADPVTADVSNHGIALIKEAFVSWDPDLTESQMTFSAGNHESDMASGINVNETGAYEYQDYFIYVINEDDFPAYFNSYGGLGEDGYKKRCQQTATNLMAFLNERIAAADTRPIFIMCHVPLHVVSRLQGGDDKCASYIPYCPSFFHPLTINNA